MATGTIETAFGLTPLQEGMLYHSIREPGAGVYHSQYCVALSGPVQPDLLVQAWRRATERYPVLRTFFAWERRERPLQVVRSTVDLDFEHEDWRDASDVEARWAALLERDRARGIDLGVAPVMRWVLVALGAERWRLLWSVHHTVLDGWSGRMVLREVLADHERLRAGVDHPLPATIGFDHFVGWLETQLPSEAESFWRSALTGAHLPTPLPWDGGVSTQARLRTETFLDAAATDAVRTGAARLRVTPATLVVGAWALLLGRLSGRDDVVVGATVSERPAEIDGVEEAAGLYLSTLPLRVQCDAADAGGWLRALHGTLAQARARATPGLTRIQRWAEVPGRLFDSVIVYESFPTTLDRTDLGAVRIADEHLLEHSDLPLALLVFPGERLRLQLVHDPGRVSASAADALLQQTAGLLRALAGADADSTSALPTLEPGVAERRLAEWSGAAAPAPAVEDVVARVQRHVAAAPDAPALITSERTWSYDALDQAASAVADTLLRAGLAPGARVAVWAARAPETVIAELGVLKAGCAFLLCDPAAPPERTAHLLTYADAVWAGPEVPDTFAAPGRPRLTPTTGSASPRVERPVAPDTPAYVVFTSGSTGVPKGVVVERGHLAWSTGARSVCYPEPPARFLLLSPMSVDSSLAGIWWTLCAGGALVVPDARAEQDPERLTTTMAEAGVTHTLLVPSLWRELLAHADPAGLGSLRRVIVAGEACPASVVRAHRAALPGVPLHNEYGPSETTVWATVDELTGHAEGPVAIGRPVPGARAYVLDDSGVPVTPGAPGALVVGGEGVARGYLDGSAADQARFAPDPFRSGGRVYHTGDRVRFLPDGRLEFLGRLDDQIKVRGFRVEPAEIERILGRHPAVREAVVVLHRAVPAPDVDALVTALSSLPEAEREALLTGVERG
ncbi:MAG: amino acid adenylation domain-containing protein [Gemmatimonadota bacterium]